MRSGFIQFVFLRLGNILSQNTPPWYLVLTVTSHQESRTLGGPTLGDAKFDDLVKGSYQISSLERCFSWGSWVAHSGWRPTFNFSSGHDLTVCEFKPCVKPAVQSLLGILSSSLSLSLALPCAFSQNKLKKKKKRKEAFHCGVTWHVDIDRTVAKWCLSIRWWFLPDSRWRFAKWGHSYPLFFLHFFAWHS